MPQLILASASARRLALLGQIGVTPDRVEPADIDETPHAKELPKVYAARMAREKATLVAAKNRENFVLAADTVVSCGRRILPKADNNEQVSACLKLLSGRSHTVITGVCVLNPDGKTAQRINMTKVMFKRLSEEEIKTYLESEEGLGKAGGYAIQGRAGAFVKHLNGSYSSVVGLPLYEAANLLTGLGYE